MLTQAIVCELFDYDPETGILLNKDGTDPESLRHRYWAVRIDGVRHYSHRVIWLWLFGYLPDYIDHIDGNTFNNREENLRECTMSQNLGNVSYGPMRGIEKHGRKYRVRIGSRSHRIELGSFDTLEDAIAARDKGYVANFGEFARI